ncbi:hypothetical protein ISS42_02445 [Candidatus Shapirobacteria bacterium]|nr:hypothetical protein [Candidatus Shapirobacteria bacterium]
MNNYSKKIIKLLILSLLLPVILASLQGIYDWRKGAAGKPAYIRIDASRPQANINPALWQNFCQGGEEPKDMIGPVINQVKALSPQIIRIDHIYDYFNIVRPDNTFDFSRLDVMVKSILATGAKPMLSLSYIPPAWSADGQITSPPQDWSLWEKLVTATVEQYSGKNNLNIYNVYYEVYNEPDLFGGWHYGKNPNYLTLYFHSAQGAQKAKTVNSFKIGGPAITGFYPNWIRALLKHAQKNSLLLDFISWHRYSADLADYDQDFEKLAGILTDYPTYQNLEKYITEFGPESERSSWYKNQVGAAHALAVSTHLLDKVHRIFAFELKDGPGNIENQWGLLKHENQGAALKPRYLAYQFLNQLSGKRLPLEGNGTWVSGVAARKNNSTLIFLVNFDPREKHTELVPVQVNNLSPGKYQLKLDYLFGSEQTLIKEISNTSLLHQVYLEANEAVFLTLNPAP